ncbi:hypothetical protein ACPOL_6213 [Acidisarcina polymorpha]|uniref:ParB-related ThiF-related cassette protein E domain-containing protein n=1 Tax=Acidisarcina polymorpha TaxID=2211140 RepID=A0A2Z5G9F7_9BACT|nr:PRTRC system protein E [Acidisarcina polymorpha]AXC15457.1 hypothetical protein ACPOL_6213 [Acidisarcina polymorpha]
MFRELAPYLRHRAVLLTVTHLEHDQIRVNVVPKKLKDGENEALTTPLSVTGTAEELDTELPQTLTDYVAAHLQLNNTLASAKAQMDAAAKTAQEEARAKSKNNSNPGKKDCPAISGMPSAEELGPVATPKPAPSRSPSLFDLSPALMPAPVPETSKAVRTAGAEDEDEILSEIDSQREHTDDLDAAA